MTVSVIIPTRGREACLRQTLRDLALQNYAEFDIWVIDQNDKPLTGLASDAAGAKLIHETMQPLGSHAGRNHAIFQTKSELCVFVDDDVRLDRGFIASHVAAMSGDAKTKVGAVAGRVIQPRDGFSEDQMRRMGRAARYNRFTGQVSGNFVGSLPERVEHIHECNFSARTETLLKIGGFNEEFQGNAYFEGADLALRIIEAGYMIEYHPEIVLTHLQEGAGGNRVPDKASHTYWFMRNYGLLGSLHMNPVGLPVFGSLGLAYVLGKAVKNRNVTIATSGLRGLLAGLKYFLPGRPRLRTRNSPRSRS